jgi:DNA repair ATPase RecN
MTGFLDNHLIQAIILSLVALAIAISFFVHPLLSALFVFVEIILTWQFSKRLDQREDVRHIINNLNEKEKRITDTYIEVKQVRDEIKKMQNKIFDSFSSRGFDAIEKRVYNLENIVKEDYFNNLVSRVKKLEESVEELKRKLRKI